MLTLLTHHRSPRQFPKTECSDSDIAFGDCITKPQQANIGHATRFICMRSALSNKKPIESDIQLLCPLKPYITKSKFGDIRKLAVGRFDKC